MKLFSIQEANDLLPFLRQSLARIHQELRGIRGLVTEVQPAQRQAHFGGGSLYGPAFIRHVLTFQQYARQVQSAGIQVKDYDLGLCDFPYDLDGHIVYLCWKLGEEDVRWWHEIDAGFAGRQPLD